MKKCWKCNKIKRLNYFHLSKNTKDGHHACCKKCRNKYYNQWIKNPINKFKMYLNCKKWQEENREKSRKLSNDWKKKNKKRMSDYQNNYIKNKVKINLKYKILIALRKRISIALRHHFKYGYTIDLLGCSINQLKQYLEKKFTKGMNWNNYGRTGWHIDHIRPCASFDLSKESEQRKCFNYTNLQPLWYYENCSKQDNIK